MDNIDRLAFQAIVDRAAQIRETEMRVQANYIGQVVNTGRSLPVDEQQPDDE